MKRLSATLLLLILTATPAGARELLEYTIRHPVFGEIGTYSNLIEPAANGGITVTSRLDVTVKLIGITAHREHSVRRERWQDGRLIAFFSTTEKNGERYELRGEAREGGFVIHTPQGTQMAPAHVLPSNPWSVDMLRSGPLLSTRNGALLTARVTDGPAETIMRGGRPERLRRFDIDSDKREYVWVDAQGVPVAFRTIERGDPVDFILTRRETGAGTQQASAQPVTDTVR
jgi:hypothetical protein